MFRSSKQSFFLQVFPLKPCMHFVFSHCMPHAMPFTFFILSPESYLAKRTSCEALSCWFLPVFLSTCSDLPSMPVLLVKWGTVFHVCMKQQCKLTVVSLFIYFWRGRLNEYIIKEIKIDFTKVILYYIKNVFQVITDTHLLQEFAPFFCCVFCFEYCCG